MDTFTSVHVECFAKLGIQFGSPDDKTTKFEIFNYWLTFIIFIPAVYGYMYSCWLLREDFTIMLMPMGVLLTVFLTLTKYFTFVFNKTEMLRLNERIWRFQQNGKTYFFIK